MLHQQDKDRRKKDRHHINKEPAEPQIRPCYRRKIIIIGILYNLKQGGRQNHRCRRIVTQDHNASLQNTCCRGIRPFRKLKLRKRIQPAFFKNTFSQTLLVHSERIHVNAPQTLHKLPEHTGIHTVTHITDRHIRLRASTDIHQRKR